MKRGTAHDGGFTVIELLVASAVAVALAGMLIVVTRSALTFWQKSHGRSTANIQAKVALDLIVRDLESAISIPDKATFAATIVSDNQLDEHGWRLGEASPIKPNQISIGTDDENMRNSRFGRGGCGCGC